MMRQWKVVGLISCLLLFGMASGGFSQEKKMSREEYTALQAEYADREAKAQGEITALDAELAELKKQLADLQSDIDGLNADILALVGAQQAEVRAYGQRLDGILRQLQGLAALAPEELQLRRGELKAAVIELKGLTKSAIAALPEMKAKIDEAWSVVEELFGRAPDSITYSVVRGDHLWGIASKAEIYDEPYMWPRLYRANREQIKDPDLIYPDQVLNVPIAVSENQFLVTSGDFLSSIAAAVYNDPTKWHRIYKANAEQIVEPSLIFPAQILEIPSN